MIVEKLKGTNNSEIVNLENSIVESGKKIQINKIIIFENLIRLKNNSR